tara:strand:+ start:1157 stop:1615 length:459 start_codon:yes stop_codon:yes gene_type:complete
MSLNSVKQELSKIAPDLKIIEFDKSTASVEEAALAHEVEPGKIVKTIALIVEKPILLMTSGDVKIDNKKYKNFFKKKAKMLTADETLQITSHPIGGVCPFGLPNKLGIYYDKSLNNFDIVIPAAGSTNSSVEVQTKRLIELTSAFEVDVCKK